MPNRASRALELKVVSLNMWHGGRLFDQMLAFLKGQDADVVLLQEVFNDHNPKLEQRFRSLDVLKRELGYKYHNFAPTQRMVQPEGKIEEGVAILTRFPIISAKSTFLAEPYNDHYIDIPENYASSPRPLQHVVLDTPYGELNVFNIHGVWDLDGDNFSERRQKMSKTIIGAIRGLPNVILAGDTNSRPTNPAMQALEGYLTPVFGTELKSTFNMRHKDDPGYATSAVDLMYVSSTIRVLAKECPDVDVSDHRPLVVRLAV
jgi:endonuclease/exonuclease/phosphatase family metal-dependent hydrolase